MRIVWLASLVAISCSGGAKQSGPAVPPDPSGPVDLSRAGLRPPPIAPVTIKRTVISLSRRSGTVVTTTRPDGQITVEVRILENGRGPKVDARLRLAPDGTIASYAASGKHTFGAVVDEHFSREGGRAQWKSAEEQGEHEVTGPAFFLPLASVPDAQGMLVRAALANGGKIALLPSGTATVEKIGEVTVNGSGEARKTVRKLTGYAIIGVDLTPSYTWMNADGTWFGSAYSWRSYMPEGWESAIAPLIAKQEEYKRARQRKLADAHAHKPPAAGLAYTNARVLDVIRGKWLAKHTVLVVGDTIKAVGPTGRVAIPKDAEVVDLAGRALVPGLVDMHAHLGDSDGVLNIASGVTAVRDVGNDPDDLDDYKKRFDEGAAIGPHVFRFGFIEGRNEKAASSKITAETVDEAKAAVEFYAKRGYEGVKIYNSVKPELVPVIAAEAHARKLQVTGHIPVHMLAHEAVKAGYDGIEHINMLFLNFFATHETDTRDTTRFTLVGDKAGALDLKSKPVRDFIELLRTRRTVIDPTLTAFMDLFLGEQGKIVPYLAPTVARLPVVTQRRFLTGGLPVSSPAQREQYKAAYAKLLAMVKALHDAKVPIVAGTDAIAGLALHQELQMFVHAGLSPATVMQIATIGAARVLRQDARFGTIAAGKRADLVVVDGDPLADIRAIGAVVSTMRGGVVFPSAPLYEAVGVRPYAAK